MASEELLNTVEKAIDATEETLDTIERIPSVNLNGTTKKQQYIILGVTALVSAAIGSGVTYVLVKDRMRKRYKLRYQEISNREIAAAKDYYAARSKRDQYATPTQVLQDTIKKKTEESENEFAPDSYVQTVDALSYNPEDTEKSQTTEEAVVDEPTVHNVFSESEYVMGDFDYETEIAARTPKYPYIIHYDEFFGEEGDDKGYSQVTLTYYEQDDVLVDDREQPVDDSEAVVGDTNLTRFGHGSNDPNIVYIRNDRLEVDFEVVLAKNSYVRDVLGFIEHSDDGPKIRKFRSDRE